MFEKRFRGSFGSHIDNRIFAFQLLSYSLCSANFNFWPSSCWRLSPWFSFAFPRLAFVSVRFGLSKGKARRQIYVCSSLVGAISIFSHLLVSLLCAFIQQFPPFLFGIFFDFFSLLFVFFFSCFFLHSSSHVGRRGEWVVCQLFCRLLGRNALAHSHTFMHSYRQTVTPSKHTHVHWAN